MEKQICPICGSEVHPSPRYPNYVCGNCVHKAKSEDGKSVRFYNEHAGGVGCIGKYTETETKYEGNILYIDGIKCYAQKAYFGGIVIRPVIE